MDTFETRQERLNNASCRNRRFLMPSIASSRGSASFSRSHHSAKMPYLPEEDFDMGLPAINAKPFVPSYRPTGLESTTETGNKFETTFSAIDSETHTFYTMSPSSSSGYKTAGIQYSNGNEMKNVGGYGLGRTMIGENHETRSRFCTNGGTFISPVKRSESNYLFHASRSPTPSPAPSLVSSEYSCSLSDSPFPLGTTTIPTNAYISVQTSENSYLRNTEVITPNYTKDCHQIQDFEMLNNTPKVLGGSLSAFRSPHSMQRAEYHNFTPISEDDASVYYTPKYSRNVCHKFNDNVSAETSTNNAEKDLHRSHETLPQCAPNSKLVSPSHASAKHNTHTRTSTSNLSAPIMPPSPISLCLLCDSSSSVSPADCVSPSMESRNKVNDQSYLARALRAKDLSRPSSQCASLCCQRNCTEDYINSDSSPKFQSQSPRVNVSPGISAPCSPPLPQNLKGDPHRQAKVKTELCLYFSRGSACPFGVRCNYAHGEEELKYTKLEELRQAGLIDDINAYRAHPCFSWVATGACPFGLRCSNFHDPRVGGTNSSWLPHSDVPIPNLQTDLNVDKKHHQTLASLSQQNPLVHNLIWDLRPSSKKKALEIPANDEDQTEWRDTYSLVCNLASLNTAKKAKDVDNNTPSNLKITELQKLCVAVHMGYSDEKCGVEYVYKPEHTVYNELCMVIRTNYYRFLKPDNLVGACDYNEPPPIDSIICKITAEEYQESKSMHSNRFQHPREEVIVVRELAFGCAGEPSSRLSLWFEIRDIHVVKLTPQEVKRFKRSKQRVKAHRTSMTKKLSPYPESCKIVPFPQVRGHALSTRTKAHPTFVNHPHKPFFYVQPASSEQKSLRLIREMIFHRISVLIQREYRAYLGTETKVRDDITAKDAKLREGFQQIKAAYVKWNWPVTHGRDQVTDKTPVPKCSSRYTPKPSSVVSRIWDGFLQAQGDDNIHKNEVATSQSKLCVFRDLSMSRAVDKNVRESATLIPCIANNFDDETSNDAWKSILLDSDSNDDWQIIKDYYLEANRLKKDKCMPLGSANGERA